MRPLLAAVLVVALLASSSPALAQTSTPATRPRSRATAIAGLFVVGAGIGLVSVPGETYTILGDRYCVTERAVDYGACSRSPEARRVGLFVLATGGAMLAFGLSRVTVSPTYKGATASYTVTW